MAKFKQTVLDQIKTDPGLFAAVAKAMGLKPTSMAMTLERNGNTLNQYEIVVLVANHLGTEPEDLLEKEPTEAAAK